jgi:hypothetical protein
MNNKLRQKARSQLNEIGLDILNSTSEPESDYDGNVSSLNESTKVLKSSKKKIKCSGSSEDSEQEYDMAYSCKSKTKSGTLAKAGDRVVNRQQYPQSSLGFEYVTGSITFDKLDLKLFVAGELDFISNPSVHTLERKAGIKLLKKLMYACSSYDFTVVKSFYAAVLREIELDHLKWGESYQYVVSAMLTCHVIKKGVNVKHRAEKADQIILIGFGFVVNSKETNAIKNFLI